MADRRLITDAEFFAYLDELRESGVTNMNAAPSWLVRDFDINQQTARDVFERWKQYIHRKEPE